MFSTSSIVALEDGCVREVDVVVEVEIREAAAGASVDLDTTIGKAFLEEVEVDDCDFVTVAGEAEADYRH